MDEKEVSKKDIIPMEVKIATNQGKIIRALSEKGKHPQKSLTIKEKLIKTRKLPSVPRPSTSTKESVNDLQQNQSQLMESILESKKASTMKALRLRNNPAIPFDLRKEFAKRKSISSTSSQTKDNLPSSLLIATKRNSPLSSLSQREKFKRALNPQKLLIPGASAELTIASKEADSMRAMAESTRKTKPASKSFTIVSAHPRRQYVRTDGTVVSSSNVSEHLRTVSTERAEKIAEIRQTTRDEIEESRKRIDREQILNLLKNRLGEKTFNALEFNNSSSFREGSAITNESRIIAVGTIESFKNTDLNFEKIKSEYALRSLNNSNAIFERSTGRICYSFEAISENADFNSFTSYDSFTIESLLKIFNGASDLQIYYKEGNPLGLYSESVGLIAFISPRIDDFTESFKEFAENYASQEYELTQEERTRAKYYQETGHVKSEPEPSESLEDEEVSDITPYEYKGPMESLGDSPIITFWDALRYLGFEREDVADMDTEGVKLTNGKYVQMDELDEIVYDLESSNTYDYVLKHLGYDPDKVYYDDDRNIRAKDNEKIIALADELDEAYQGLRNDKESEEVEEWLQIEVNKSSID